jgi:N6-L-threonylcarbamoyladenine synthase
MIALAGAMRVQGGLATGTFDGAFDVKPRWALDAIV